MKALVYHGPGKKSLDERPVPKIDRDTHRLEVARTLAHAHVSTLPGRTGLRKS